MHFFLKNSLRNPIIFIFHFVFCFLICASYLLVDVLLRVSPGKFTLAEVRLILLLVDVYAKSMPNCFMRFIAPVIWFAVCGVVGVIAGSLILLVYYCARCVKFPTWSIFKQDVTYFSIGLPVCRLC